MKSNKSKRIIALVIILLVISFPAWYGINWYVTGLADQKQLIEFGMEEDFLYCNNLRPELMKMTGPFDYYKELMHAIEGEKTEIVRRLLEIGVQPQSPYRTNWGFHESSSYTIPVQAAARTGNAEIMQLLIDHGGNVSQPNKDYYDALCVAAKYDNKHLIPIMLPHRKKSRSKSVMILAIEMDNLALVKLLVKHGWLIDMPSLYGELPLLKAAELGKLEIVECLLLSGANVDANIGNGMTALELAVKNNHTMIYNLLLENGAKLNGQNQKNQDE